jgi:sulfite reductase alpha subunit
MVKTKDKKRPLLDQLESGEWPSFVTDLKELAREKPSVDQLLDQLEESYANKWNYWQGTLLNLPGYGGGVIARISDLGEKYPDIKEFHTIRIIPPAGFVYNTGKLRELCDISEKHSAGIMQLHGMTGDILMLGSNSEQTFEAGEDLMEKGWDIGGSGAALRTLACCIGEARCETACFDTMGLTKHITDTFIGFLHRPEFSYKFKFKLSGCANDCANSMQRSDMPIIGTWRGPMQIDQGEVAKFIDENGEEYVKDVVMGRCPADCMSLDGKKMVVDDDSCVHCMHCINVMHKALAPGKDKGATILLGGKRTLKIGDTMGSVLIPFMPLKTKEDWDKLTELIERIWDFWADNGHEHERVGEFIARIGLGTFLDNVGIKPDPRMIREPRVSPYIKFEELSTPKFDGEQKQNPRVMNKDIVSNEKVEG